MVDIFAFLKEHQIPYRHHQHPAVFTCQEADRLVPPMAAHRTKNLFLRDRKGLRHFLVVVGYDKSVDLKSLGALLGVDRLLLGSARRMQEMLGVEPGSVTILGLVQDQTKAVEVIFDLPIAAAPALRCHPLVNTATLEIAADDILRFLEVTGHPLRILDIPAIRPASQSDPKPAENATCPP